MMSGSRILARIGRNSSYTTLATAISSVGGLAGSVLIARALGPGEYGKYTYIMWLVGNLTLVANLGLPNTVVRFLGEYGTSARSQHLYRQLLRLEAAVALALALGLIAWGVAAGKDTWLLVFSVALLVVTALGRITSAALSGLQDYAVAARTQIVCVPLLLLLMAVSLATYGHLVGILLAGLVTETLRCFMLVRGVNRQLRAAAEDTAHPLGREDWLRIGRYSGVIFLLMLADAVVWQKSEVFFLERFSTLEVVAIYSLSYGLVYMVMQVPTSISNILLPVFAEGYGTGNNAVMGRGYYLATKYLALAVVPLGVLAIVLAPQLIAMLYGPAYSGAVPILRVLLATAIIATFNRPISTALLGAEKQNFVLGTTVVLALVNVLFDLALIPRHGALGASFANGLTQLICIAVGGIFVLSRLQLSFPWMEVTKIMSSAVAAGALFWSLSLFLSSLMHCLVCLLLFLPTFAYGLRLLQPWNQDDGRILAVAEENCPPRLRHLLLAVRCFLRVGTPNEE